MIITEFTNYSTLDWLARVTRRAADEGLRLRLSQGVDAERGPYIKFALGGGMWSAPLYTDAPVEQEVVQPRLIVGVNGEPVVVQDVDEDVPEFSDPLVEAAYHGKALNDE